MTGRINYVAYEGNRKVLPAMNSSVINIEMLNGEAKEIAMKIVGKDRRLRATKPKGDGSAVYVWRMVSFMISTNPRMWCMPCTHDFQLMDEAPLVPHPYAEKSEVFKGRMTCDMNWVRSRTKELDLLVDEICNIVPKSEWYGLKRWAKVFS